MKTSESHLVLCGTLVENESIHSDTSLAQMFMKSSTGQISAQPLTNITSI